MKKYKYNKLENVEKAIGCKQGEALNEESASKFAKIMPNIDPEIAKTCIQGFMESEESFYRLTNKILEMNERMGIDDDDKTNEVIKINKDIINHLIDMQKNGNLTEKQFDYFSEQIIETRNQISEELDKNRKLKTKQIFANAAELCVGILSIAGAAVTFMSKNKQ